MYIALLKVKKNDCYRGVNRCFPEFPHTKSTRLKWEECFDITCGGDAVPFDTAVFKKFIELATLLKRENIGCDIVVINPDEKILKCRFIGHDITNDTMLYSVLSELKYCKQPAIEPGALNSYGLFSNEDAAKRFASYMNDNIMLFEYLDGMYRPIGIGIIEL